MTSRIRVIALVIIAALGAGCTYSYQEAESKTNSKTNSRGGTFRTIEHDGHKFVVCRVVDGGVGLEHHPDCPCQ
jgi:hypothetical protein